MTEPLSQETMERLIFLLREDKNALKLCLDLLFVGHLWDDLIDKDRERTPEEINEAFLLMTGEIPMNPFYQAFQLQLSPLMHSAALLWLDSVRLETGTPDERTMAFIIRESLNNIVHYSMLLLGGPAWIKEHGLELWQILSRGYARKYKEFLKEKETEDV